MARPPEAPPTSSSSRPPAPSTLTTRLLTLCFLIFVAGWLAVGVRGLVKDDSRWAWGMFPYILDVEVRSVAFVDSAGQMRPWRYRGRPRLPRVLRTGRPDNYGYGEGAYRDLVERLLTVAARDAAKGDVAVEVVVVSRRSERPERQQTIRRTLR